MTKIPKRYDEPTVNYTHRVPVSRAREIRARANAFIDALLDGRDPGGTSDTGEWKDGFAELYAFFMDLRDMIQKVVTTQAGRDLWNQALQRRNLQLISTLGRRLNNV